MYSETSLFYRGLTYPDTCLGTNSHFKLQSDTLIRKFNYSDGLIGNHGVGIIHKRDSTVLTDRFEIRLLSIHHHQLHLHTEKKTFSSILKPIITHLKVFFHQNSAT